jgi:GNAT superfamily N-acetyltransferase
MSAVLDRVIVGLVGAAVIGLLKWTWSWVIDKVRARRFPVAGTFASSFKDPDGTHPKNRKATAELKQRGHRVFGSTVALADNRTWELRGQIDRGRLYGTYEAEDLADTGIGSFFLDIKSKDKFEGLWAGINSARDTTTGEYRFWRVTDVQLRPMQAQHLSEVRALLGEALGKRYMDPDKLTEVVDSPWRWVARVALDKEIVVGAMAVELVDYETLLKRIPKDMVRDVRKATPELVYGNPSLVRSIAVSKESRGRGVGTRLIECALGELWERGATEIVLVGSASKRAGNIGGVVESLGFTAAETLRNYWKKDSSTRAYTCPVCHTSCSCSATLYVMRRGDVPATTRPAPTRSQRFFKVLSTLRPD